ncbi:YfaZ family outer membrane protein [Larsenimonas salina]|uniref:YfaZ family outer membrane protein n=1 Tax=Larsenimonas salina TaxID=1295565 RepID=UPI0020748074|nr:YfaZ family outer membrane protein [Larsenimonas salina]MCM5705100.1 YfaZ family protein [Larsenimonas salina]
MKKILSCAAGLGLAFAATNSFALSLNANTSSNGTQVNASQGLFPGLDAGIGYFETDDNGHTNKAYSGSLMFSPYTPLVDLSVGARYQYWDAHQGHGGGVGLGGSAFVDTPIPRVSVGGYGFYTPEGLSHGDYEKGYEYGAQLRATLLANTYGYVGYRYVRADFDGHDTSTLDSGPVFGVSVGF